MSNASNSFAEVTAPVAAKRPIVRSHHGREFVDDYEWLREKASQEVRDYLDAENAYTEAQTAHLANLRENLFTELKNRVKETDMSVPTRIRGWWYFTRTQEGKSYGMVSRVKATGAADEVPPTVDPEKPLPGEQLLLDCNELAEGHDFFAMGTSTPNDSGTVLAYSTDTAGDERYTLVFKDLATGELLPDRLENIDGGGTWLGDDYFFYTRVDEAWRPYQIWRHKLGTDVADDVLVFQEDDERFWLGVGTTRSEKFLLVAAGSKITSEVYYLNADDPEGELTLIRERESGLEYDVDHVQVAGEDYWVVTHNAFGPNFAVSVNKVGEKLEFDQSHTLVPHRDDVRIEGIDPFRDYLALGYRAGGIGRLAIMDLKHGAPNPDAAEGSVAKLFGTFEQIDFDEELYTCGMSANPEWDAQVLRISYGSFTTPGTLYQLDPATGERIVLKQQEVIGGYDPSEYTSTRLWVTAEDGVRIPVSLVHRADLDLGQPNPVLLYGYGSYEHSIDPAFSLIRMSLMDRGIIFAVAHVRGGGEMGRGWYDTGKTVTKKNTFTDFIAVAKDLLRRGVTTREQMVASGGSAGGLLMGAVANMGGEYFHAIHAAVPFVDPLTSMLMPELPLTATEWDEWGNPLAEVEVYDYMASYAPYENVEAKQYPNILAVTSINDTRVLYVEPAKWIAKLRATATGGQFLLKTEMAAGHGGVSGRYDSWRQAAFEYAWMINQITGLTE
ncbi:S9 family peptidase [Corynebacterium aquilae]|uniref:Protease 2 n=1 Tax=Corynebacterium aquilae DSM 44791 TaxID=1431546 RepID=A0A1L7CHV6_9CORY|nr:S9 family peptidase [Corynebacterium aquilae]APT85442.1 protease 2 [Corynebacterium aquilae DSM 44791]